MVILFKDAPTALTPVGAESRSESPQAAIENPITAASAIMAMLRIAAEHLKRFFIRTPSNGMLPPLLAEKHDYAPACTGSFYPNGVIYKTEHSV
jgi:hypothetical protein